MHSVAVEVDGHDAVGTSVNHCEKRGLWRPSKFDPRFSNVSYLMTEDAQSRLKGYLRTFIYMTVCGVLLVLGGAAFFLHESVTMANHTPTSHTGGNKSSAQGRISPDYTKIAQVTYARELRVVGYAFLAVGGLFIVIGIPLIYQFWRRYTKAKEMERCPMLDPTYQKELQQAYYTSPSGRPGLKKITTHKCGPSRDNYKKTARKWFWNRKESVTAEAFRIAAHHHPSFNLVPIESLAALSRNEKFETYSDTDSEYEPLSLSTIPSGPATPSNTDESEETAKNSAALGLPCSAKNDVAEIQNHSRFRDGFFNHGMEQSLD